MLGIGEDIVDDLKISLMTPRNSAKIIEIEPEAEPIVQDPLPKLSEVIEEEDQENALNTFTSIELDPEDEFWDENGRGLDFNPAVSQILKNFVPLPTKHQKRVNLDLRFSDQEE